MPKCQHHLPPSLILPAVLLAWVSVLQAAEFDTASNGSGNTPGASAYAGTPCGGVPRIIPGVVQAEDYDVAPGNSNGIAYYKRPPVRYGNRLGRGLDRATGDNIGLWYIGTNHVSTGGEKIKEGGVYVGSTTVEQWWKYTVDVKESGTYAFGGHFAAGKKGAKLIATFTPLGAAGGHEVATGPMEIPTTAGFQPGVEVYHVWETLDELAEVKLAAGLYVMTVKLDGPETVVGLNIDYYTFKLKAANAPEQ